MNRPQIKNPVTGKVINLFSKEIESLLDDGYTIEQVLNLNIFPSCPKIPLTGIEDIDLYMMTYLPINDLVNLSTVNQYTAKLCTNKHFWIEKFKKEGLIPKDEVDWIKAYQILLYINKYIIKLGKMDSEDCDYFNVNDKFKYPYYKQLINQSDDLNEDHDIKKIEIYHQWYTGGHKFYIGLFVKNMDIARNRGYSYEEASFTTEEFREILFKLYYDGVILNLL